MTIENLKIRDIKTLTELEVKQLATESTMIKDHTVYFVDLKGYYGYSALVYKNNHQIHYVNDYELHHKNRTHEELKKIYINGISSKIFTESEIINDPIKDYNDYQLKNHYLYNYWHMQFDYVSSFAILNTEEQKKAFDEKIKGMTYCPIGFYYIKDKSVIDRHIKLYKALEANNKKATTNNYDYWYKAFLHEFWNHEYCINYQGDYDVINAIGSVEWLSDCAGYNDYLNASDLNEVQKKAYKAARSEYLNKCEY